MQLQCYKEDNLDLYSILAERVLPDMPERLPAMRLARLGRFREFIQCFLL